MKQIRPCKDTIAKDFNRHQNGPHNGSVSSHWSEYEPTNSIRRNSPILGEERRSGKRDRKKSSPSIDMASKAYCNLCVNINNPSTYQKFLLLFPRHSPASLNHHLCYLQSYKLKKNRILLSKNLLASWLAAFVQRFFQKARRYPITPKI